MATMNLEKEFKLIGKIRSSKERKAKLLELFRSIAQGVITSKKGEAIILVKRNNQGEFLNLTVRPLNKDWTYFWIERNTWSQNNIWRGPGTIKQIAENIRIIGFSPIGANLAINGTMKTCEGGWQSFPGKRM